MNYLFITAAIGSEGIQAAANRLSEDAMKLGVFQDYHIVTQPELFEFIPEIIAKVPIKEWNYDNRFGYYIWKAQIAKAAMAGRWGSFDGLMYLDAGCEILPSYWSRKRLLGYLEKARKNGAVVFDLEVLEYQYTKKQIFEMFPLVSKLDRSGQIQSGSWILSGQLGKEIASVWAESSAKDYELISNEFNPTTEEPDFILPRHDQSFFSLTCKSFGILPEIETPPGGGNGVRTQLRALYFPFRWARNRSGKKTNFVFYRALGSLSLKVYHLIRIVKKDVVSTERSAKK